MKSVSIQDIKGQTVGKFTLDQAYFDGKINKPLLHQAVLMYLANRRLGCASTKTRKQVSGGGRKPWRQKGTGRARAGSIRSPLWRGGGIVFGPHPKSFKYSLSKNIRHQALRSSLNGKIRDNELIVADHLSLKEVKTKEFANILEALKAKKKTLVVLEKYNLDILRASANIPTVTIKVFSDISCLDVLNHEKIIFSKQALENLIKLRNC